jgi:hypothetical protein
VITARRVFMAAPSVVTLCCFNLVLQRSGRGISLPDVYRLCLKQVRVTARYPHTGHRLWPLCIFKTLPAFQSVSIYVVVASFAWFSSLPGLCDLQFPTTVRFWKELADHELRQGKARSGGDKNALRMR